ncbi:mechanosensitive ion channel family protein [Novosphingobium panipatense]|uniref:mechanosensitive ion channel family protein n=1 Tax=Novosphingobium TaxID=165696 RepID=UPI000CDAB716|nr:mechanosensitive ion channel family protein [Novosphingobium sp. HII-3]
MAFFAALFLAVSPARAQLVPEPAASASAVPVDPFGRGTPRSTITGLINALAQQDYDRAAFYFDLPVETNPHAQRSAAEFARRLQALLDSGGSLTPFSGLSNDTPGSLDDDLPLNRERVGTITVNGKPNPVLLGRKEVDGHTVWRVPVETMRVLAVAKVPQPGTQATEGAEAIAVAGAPVQDWMVLAGLAILSFGGLWILSAVILAGGRRFVPKADSNGWYRFLSAALPPLNLIIAVAAFYIWAEKLPVAIVARQTLLRYIGIFAVVGFVWLGLRLVDAISDIAIARMRRQARRQVVSVVTLIRRGAKILLLAFSAIGILDTFGIDVTTGIAALGIGGIALALGAQKTVENLVGSVTVIADRPAQVGDFVRVGDVVGTVEDVGIRSTRIRTNDRTIVTIPNGDFSARQIENFSSRDRFLFNPVIHLDLGLPSAKLKEAITIVQTVLAENAHIAEGARARLATLGEASLQIEVFSYIAVSDFDHSVIIREELLLAIVERFEAAAISLVTPVRNVLLSSDAREPENATEPS